MDIMSNSLADYIDLCAQSVYNKIPLVMQLREMSVGTDLYFAQYSAL